MSDATLIRLVILGLGLIWLAYIWWSWQRRHGQAKSNRRSARAPAASLSRTEPMLGNDAFDHVDEDESKAGIRDEFERLGREIADRRRGQPVDADEPDERDTDSDNLDSPVDEDAAPRIKSGGDQAPRQPAPRLRHEPVGQRPEGAFERIVTLHVVARDGEMIAGPELIVAAERSGLVFGDMDIFHRMVDGYAERGPIFSVANMMRPGSFDMSRIHELRTPGVTFFMTLPGPLRAIDAWDTMLPAAQRFAELLDAQVLDEQRNALARQTIQLMREELRAWDRARERQTIKRSW